MLESQDLYTSDTVKNHPFGSLAFGYGGKLYRYAQVDSAAALIKGNTLQEAITNTSYDEMAIGTAGVVGDKYLQVTNGNATITSAQFADGTIGCVVAGAGVAIGDEYVVQAVTGTLTTGAALKVWVDRPLRYAYATTTTKVAMNQNPWSGVIQSNGTTATGMPVGVAIYEMPLSTYGWVQTHGECTVLCDATTMAVGSDLALSVTVAGAAGLYAVISGRVRIGMARQANSSGKGIAAFLQID
jgi:hypothetical protein